MKYYSSDCGKYIKFNPETKVYRLGNTTLEKYRVVPIDEFNSLKTTEIKNSEYSRLMNIYFKYVQHEWEFEGVKYRKLENFEKKEYLLSANYNIGKDVPLHDLGNYKNNLILVYHWGKVYYHTIQYNGEGVGQLLCPYTLNYVRWAKLKNCAPIFNTVTKKIV